MCESVDETLTGAGHADERAYAMDAYPRLAAIVFGIYVAAAAVVIPLALGDGRWFLVDEWTVLADRQPGDLGAYFEPYNGHWITVPVVVYRVLYAIFGLHSYLPYQLFIVAAHLGLACLLRVVMRRIGVGPWIATVAAGSFVLLGSGEDNIVWAFQISLVVALICGLGQMLLVDHDGPIDRRDWFALGVGLVGLISSGVMVLLVIAVGVTVLLRRGWRPAALQTAPLAAIYLLWWIFLQPEAIDPQAESSFGGYLGLAWDYLRSGATTTFSSLGQSTVIGVLLAAVLVAGLAVAWWSLGWSKMRKRASIPIGLLVATVLVLFGTFLTTGMRFGLEAIKGTRYIHMFVALMLPVIAYAADALARRWRGLAPVMIVLLLVGIPGNIAAFETSVFGKPYFDAQKRDFAGISRSPLGADAEPSIEPEPTLAPDMTIGWLRQSVADGKMPEPDMSDPSAESLWPLRLGLAFHEEPIPADLKCRERLKAVDVDPPRGRVYGIRDGSVSLQLLDDGEPVSWPWTVGTEWAGDVIEVEADGLEFRFQAAPGLVSYTLCS